MVLKGEVHCLLHSVILRVWGHCLCLRHSVVIRGSGHCLRHYVVIRGWGQCLLHSGPQGRGSLSPSRAGVTVSFILWSLGVGVTVSVILWSFEVGVSVLFILRVWDHFLHFHFLVAMGAKNATFLPQYLWGTLNVAVVSINHWPICRSCNLAFCFRTCWVHRLLQRDMIDMKGLVEIAGR